MRRRHLLFLALAFCVWAAPNAGALTRTPPTAAPHYDEGVAVLVVVLGDGITLDTFEGNQEDPLSLHKYVYGADNPVNRIDPSGHEDIGDVMEVMNFDVTLTSVSAGSGPLWKRAFTSQFLGCSPAEIAQIKNAIKEAKN